MLYYITMLIVRRKPIVVRTLMKFCYALARPIQKSYWFIFRPYRPGAKTFIFYQDKILLARLGYAHKSWVLPGGGIDRGESPLEAAVREAYEEVGIKISNPNYVGEQTNNRQYKKVTVFYYTIAIDNPDIIIDGQEIADAGWFSLDKLPSDTRSYLRDEITMYNDWKYGQNK